MMLEIKWFTARLLFESSPDRGPERLFEERLVLLQSDSGIEGAKKKAIKLGKAAGVEYAAVSGQQTMWSFKEILDIIELSESQIKDGSEVYFHFLTEGEVDSIKESLRSGSMT